MCDASGHTGPLLRCDVYNSKEAGKLLGDMLQMGESQPWPEALVKITGTRNMPAQPLLDYFQPLITWLEKENEANNEQLGWADPWTPKEPESWSTSAAAVAYHMPVW